MVAHRVLAAVWPTVAAVGKVEGNFCLAVLSWLTTVTFAYWRALPLLPQRKRALPAIEEAAHSGLQKASSALTVTSKVPPRTSCFMQPWWLD